MAAAAYTVWKRHAFALQDYINAIPSHSNLAAFVSCIWHSTHLNLPCFPIMNVACVIPSSAPVVGWPHRSWNIGHLQGRMNRMTGQEGYT